MKKEKIMMGNFKGDFFCPKCNWFRKPGDISFNLTCSECGEDAKFAVGRHEIKEIKTYFFGFHVGTETEYMKFILKEKLNNANTTI